MWLEKMNDYGMIKCIPGASTLRVPNRLPLALRTG